MNKEKISASELGIDLTRSYSGSEVEELINIVIEEAEVSIVSSYNEGYKQATLELQPTIDILEYRLQNRKEMTFQSYFTTASIGFGIGFVLGGLTGICIKIKLD